ncbi:MAG TPA: PHP domain-containing protein [Caproicibacter sp.]|nr:PHP domain-containing protein [Caproicibacter sp.]
MAADLHCHTKVSDGSVSIEEVVMMAKLRGLSALAITDHDTFAGTKKAVAFGRKIGLNVIPGAEFSSIDSATGRKAHILCYFCEDTDKLQNLCNTVCEARRKAGSAMLEKVMQIYPIPAGMVMRRAEGSITLFKQHIMHALIDAGYAHELFGTVFHKLFSSKDGLAYVKVDYPEVHDVIEQIHNAGGVAVLAHPAEYNSYDLLNQLATDREIDGVEVWHPRNGEGDEQKFASIARENGLFMTGGTDFHGMYTKISRPIGTCTAPDDQLEQLVQIKKYH